MVRDLSSLYEFLGSNLIAVNVPKKKKYCVQRQKLENQALAAQQIDVGNHPCRDLQY